MIPFSSEGDYIKSDIENSLSNSCLNSLLQHGQCKDVSIKMF